jgi:hypothetical protein
MFVDQAAPDEGAQDTGPRAGLHVGKRRRVEFVGEGGMKAEARRLVQGDGRLEDPVDDVRLVPVLLSYVLNFLYVGISPGSPTTTCCKRARK